MATKKIGSYEAKTHLASLLDRVSKGESFTITKHGLPIAQLIPAPGALQRDIFSVIADIQDFQSSHHLGNRSILAMIKEGRKY